jgi:hypothetical protein
MVEKWPATENKSYENALAFSVKKITTWLNSNV